jgi:ABC-type glutathione transport system ATPase component
MGRLLLMGALSVISTMPQLDLTPSKLRLSPEGLQQVDTRLNQLGWRKQSPCWAESAKVAVITLKRFRARKRITADIFQAICQALGLDWRSLAESGYPQRQQDPQPALSSLKTDFGAGEKWVHRETTFPELVQRLQQGCRVLVIMGMAGVGKTVLAEQLSRHLQPHCGASRSSQLGSAGQRWVCGYAPSTA